MISKCGINSPWFICHWAESQATKESDQSEDIWDQYPDRPSRSQPISIRLRKKERQKMSKPSMIEKRLRATAIELGLTRSANFAGWDANTDETVNVVGCGLTNQIPFRRSGGQNWCWRRKGDLLFNCSKMKWRGRSASGGLKTATTGAAVRKGEVGGLTSGERPNAKNVLSDWDCLIQYDR